MGGLGPAGFAKVLIFARRGARYPFGRSFRLTPVLWDWESHPHDDGNGDKPDFGLRRFVFDIGRKGILADFVHLTGQTVSMCRKAEGHINDEEGNAVVVGHWRYLTVIQPCAGKYGLVRAGIGAAYMVVLELLNNFFGSQFFVHCLCWQMKRYSTIIAEGVSRAVIRRGSPGHACKLLKLTYAGPVLNS